MASMRKRFGASAIVLGLLAHPAVGDPPDDRAIDVQTFEYAVGPKSFFTVSDADVAAKKQLAVDALFTLITNPFKIYNVDDNHQITSERVVVVKSMYAAQLAVAYGIDDKLQVGANLPLVFSLTGDGLMAATGSPSPSGLSVTGTGDLIVEGKYRLYRKGGLKLAGLAAVSLPTSIGSDDSQFLGDDLPTLRGRIAAQLERGRFSAGANAGFVLRKPRTIYDTTIGQQLTWGVGATARVTDRFALIGEAYGRTGLPSFSLDASPLEAIAGVRIYATSAIAVVAGGGAGLVRGVGSPESRFFLSLGYSPDVRDTDGDRIANGRDGCPLVPEDRDGTKDDDGCPDEDNDGDHRPDATDKCPDQSEDLDGFDDDDGCPELDNDGDHIADLEDKCPMEAEDGKAPAVKDGCPAGRRDSDGDELSDAVDKCPTDAEDVDGFEDTDGCPELDNDKDGTPDAQDRCGMCAEDKDGFEDGDGCPDPDNDRDGILDAQDRCPAQPETVNGVQDGDGCPDTGGAAVVRFEDDRLVVEKVPKLAGKALSPAGAIIADQIALVIAAHPDVTKWLIVLAQPKAEAAARLADALRARLVAKGVPADRLQVIGAAGPPKINGVAQEHGEPPPVCPADKKKDEIEIEP
jgi:OmpA-OmpF porin, OOP family